LSCGASHGCGPAPNLGSRSGVRCAGAVEHGFAEIGPFDFPEAAEDTALGFADAMEIAVEKTVERAPVDRQPKHCLPDGRASVFCELTPESILSEHFLLCLSTNAG
jgi:hypothetical protein